MDWVFLAGRVAFAALFVASGLFFHLVNRGTAVEYARAKGAPVPEVSVPLTGVVILVAGLMIVIGLWMDLAALALAVFLVLTMVFMHAFWNAQDEQERMLEQVQFQKDLALAGAALVLFFCVQQLGDGIGIALEPALFD
jgi:putative oxidoreductase